MKTIISVNNLKKSFGEVKAVNDISFEVKEGSLFAFLGLNGAGKSTTINILCGDLQKDSGEVFINGNNIDNSINEIKPLIGVVYQDSVLDKQLTVKDNLFLRGALYGLDKEQINERIEKIDRLFSIKELLKRTVGKLSGGQRRRVDIARALLHQPRIIILDEPTTGLDPQTRKMVWSAIETLRKESNLTVFLTTHYMEEAANADDVIILDNGKIVAHGTPLSLKNQYSGDFIKLYNTNVELLDKNKIKYTNKGEYYQIEINNSHQAVEIINKYPEVFLDFEIIKGNMDDVFLSVTGKRLTGGNINE